ncbi:MAG: response regulator transcription factor [Rhodocyclaceae bacterium]
MRILIAEDDPNIAAGILYALKTLNHFAVDLVSDGARADTALRDGVFDLLILDLGLPRLDGFEVLHRLRARNAGLPVLIMSARDTDEDKVRGLDMGADDYIVKPFGVRELEARVRALLRRTVHCASGQISRGGLCFDMASRTASLDGKALNLSAREAAVLEVLMREFGRVVRKERLIEHLYSYDDSPGVNAIEVFIHRLRRKLAAAPVEIRTFHGVGYQLDEREPAGATTADSRAAGAPGASSPA